MRSLATMLIVFLLAVGIAFAANTQYSTADYEYAKVDTDPNSDPNDATEVYGTNAITPAVSPAGATRNDVWFSVGGSGTMTVTLQFKRYVDSAWNDYEDYTATTRILLEDKGHRVQWRGVVKEANYTSGEKIFGFDW